MKSWLIGKKPDAGKDWRQKENGMTENAVVGWHHWLNGFEPEQTQGDGEGKPGVLQFMGSQRVGHDLVTDQWGNTKSGVGDMVLYQRIIQPPRDFIVLIHGFFKTQVTWTENMKALFLRWVMVLLLLMLGYSTNFCCFISIFKFWL